MDNFKKLQEDIQAILEGNCCNESYGDYALLSMLEEFDEYDDFELNEGTNLLQKIIDRYQQKNKGCYNLEGSAKRTCLYNNKEAYLKEKLAVSLAALNACTTTICKTRMQEKVNKIKKDIAFWKQYRSEVNESYGD